MDGEWERELGVSINGYPKTHRIHVWYIYTNIGGIFMVNVTIYSIHGSYGKWLVFSHGKAAFSYISYGWMCFNAAGMMILRYDTPFLDPYS